MNNMISEIDANLAICEPVYIRYIDIKTDATPIYNPETMRAGTFMVDFENGYRVEWDNLMESDFHKTDSFHLELLDTDKPAHFYYYQNEKLVGTVTIDLNHNSYTAQDDKWIEGHNIKTPFIDENNLWVEDYEVTNAQIEINTSCYQEVCNVGYFPDDICYSHSIIEVPCSDIHNVFHLIDN